MAQAPWAVSVLLLLVLLSPGLTPAPLQHLCGSHLVDALYFVCSHRGFYYSPKHFEKRDLQHLLGYLSERAGWERDLEAVREEPKMKRGIVEQCCHKPCGLHHLEGYCD